MSHFLKKRVPGLLELLARSDSYFSGLETLVKET